MQPNTVFVPVAHLNSKVKSRNHLYSLLSQKFKLPAFTSKAINAAYLHTCCLYPCPVFRIKNEGYHPHYIVTKHVNAKEILETIEELLKEKNLPPTGFDAEKLPDLDWLINVYFFLAPKDERRLFPKSIKPTSQVTVAIDSE